MELTGFFDFDKTPNKLPALSNPHRLGGEMDVDVLEKRLAEGDREALGALVYSVFFAPRSPAELFITGGKRSLFAHEEDAVSESVTRVVRYLQTWNGSGFRAWALTILRNLLRTSPTKLEQGSQSFELLAQSEDLASYFVQAPLAERHLDQADAARVLEALRGKLSEKEETILRTIAEVDERDENRALQEVYPEAKPGTLRQWKGRALGRARGIVNSAPPSTNRRSW